MPEFVPIKPPRLQPGSTVALLAPASNVVEDDQIVAAREMLASLGFRVRLGAHLFKRHGYFAGTDEQRAADVNQAFRDQEVEGIFCMRGGYGCPRILPLLDYQAIRENPKFLMGYSDITALLTAVHAQTGLITFHGPHPDHDFSETLVRQLRAMVFDGVPDLRLGEPPLFEGRAGKVPRQFRLSRLFPGTVEGRLLGGNLSLICKLVGTPFEPEWADRIAFFEDVNESPRRIDGMLTHLRLAGRLQRCAGLVLGQFTDAEPDTYNTLSPDQVFRELLTDLGKPVLRGLAIGHVPEQGIVPIGARARLDVGEGSLTLLESVVR